MSESIGVARRIGFATERRYDLVAVPNRSMRR
jgi:hypothetical protein